MCTIHVQGDVAEILLKVAFKHHNPNGYDCKIFFVQEKQDVLLKKITLFKDFCLLDSDLSTKSLGDSVLRSIGVEAPLDMLEALRLSDV